MQTLSYLIDQHLVDLAWSLWTELGVRGVVQHHQNCLIDLETLILLTALIADIDPRLRDEALDWCSRNHHYVSISRLKALLKNNTSVSTPYSIFAATLNSVSEAKWPTSSSTKPPPFKPSGKSSTPQCERPSLLNLRLRAFFGVGARADLMTYCLTHKQDHYTASDLTEIGYNRITIAALLEGFVEAGFFEMFFTRNVRNFRLIKRESMAKVMGPMPAHSPAWRQFLEIIIPLRDCIHRVEKKTVAVKMSEARNVLDKIGNKLRKIDLTPPAFDPDPLYYWNTFSEWMIQLVKSNAEGDFDSDELNSLDTHDAAKRIEIQFRGFFENIESLKTISHLWTQRSLFENYKSSFKRHLNTYIPKLFETDQKALQKLKDKLLMIEACDFDDTLKQQSLARVVAILAKYK